MPKASTARCARAQEAFREVRAVQGGFGVLKAVDFKLSRFALSEGGLCFSAQVWEQGFRAALRS